MQKARLTLKERIVISLVGLLIFSLLLSVAGFIASYDTRRKLAAFASDGHTVTGTITNKYTSSVTENHAVWLYVHTVTQDTLNRLDVSFKTEDGKFRYQSTTVPNTLYDKLQVGNPVKVTYVRSDPELFYVADDVPNEGDVAVFGEMFDYGITASLLLLIVLAASVFWNGGGAMMVGETTDAAQSSETSLRPPHAQVRTGFGTRPRL